MARQLAPWQAELIRCLYPRVGATSPLCLAVGLSAPAVVNHARRLGASPPSLCVSCHAAPRPRGHGGRQLCEGCREKRRGRGKGPVVPLAPAQNAAGRGVDERLYARSRQLAEAVRPYQPISRHDLPGLSLVEDAVIDLTRKAPHWWEGCLRYGLSLSPEGLSALLGEAPAPSPGEVAAAEREALAARVEALIGGLAAITLALEVARASGAQCEKGKAAQTKKQRRRDSVGQLYIWVDDEGRAA